MLMQSAQAMRAVPAAIAGMEVAVSVLPSIQVLGNKLRAGGFVGGFAGFISGGLQFLNTVSQVAALYLRLLGR